MKKKNLIQSDNKNIIELFFGNATKKIIITPNHFVSHMIEHIIWRMELSGEIIWNDENWFLLGKKLGEKIKTLKKSKQKAIAMGIIDDGVSEVVVKLGKPSYKFYANNNELKYFLKSRCEQIKSSRPLIELINGLSIGLSASFKIFLRNFQDPHHSWEAIFRSMGIALGKIYPSNKKDNKIKLDNKLNTSFITRETAETKISIYIDFSKKEKNQVNIFVDKSIKKIAESSKKLLNIFINNLNCTMKIDFVSKNLSSSHVLMEDLGLTIGKALFKIIKIRMDFIGINGCGSNIKNEYDLLNNPIHICISIEGRKFWRIIPNNYDFINLRNKLLIGQNINGLFSEDLDDFVDGLASGLNASIIIFLQKYNNPKYIWKEIFASLGKALNEAMNFNSCKKGIIPGVKATLE